MRRNDRRLWASLSMTLILAACAVPGPAPVVNRTAVPPPSARPAPPPAPQVVPQAPRPPGAIAGQPGAVAPGGDPNAPIVQSAPIRSSGVQVRPLTGPEPRPLIPPSMVRSEPSGSKVPYSEVAVAAMRGAAPPAPKPEPSRAEPPEPMRADSKAPPSSDPAAFDWPARGRVTQGFAEPHSMGISIAGTPGDPVSAAADGRVIFSGPGPRGYGNLVIVKHESELLSVYAHNRSLLVKEGQNVRRGQKIAELGDSGTDRPKLHFEIRKAGKPVDPQKFLPAR